MYKLQISFLKWFVKDMNVLVIKNGERDRERERERGERERYWVHITTIRQPIFTSIFPEINMLHVNMIQYRIYKYLNHFHFERVIFNIKVLLCAKVATCVYILYRLCGSGQGYSSIFFITLISC